MYMVNLSQKNTNVNNNSIMLRYTPWFPRNPVFLGNDLRRGITDVQIELGYGTEQNMIDSVRQIVDSDNVFTSIHVSALSPRSESMLLLQSVLRKYESELTRRWSTVSMMNISIQTNVNDEQYLRVYVNVMRQIAVCCPNVKTLNISLEMAGMGSEMFSKMCQNWQVTTLQVYATFSTFEAYDQYLTTCFVQRESIETLQLRISPHHQAIYHEEYKQDKLALLTRQQDDPLLMTLRVDDLAHKPKSTIFERTAMMLEMSYVVASMPKLRSLSIEDGFRPKHEQVYIAPYAWKYIQSIRSVDMRQCSRVTEGLSDLPNLESLTLDECEDLDTATNGFMNLIETARIQSLSLHNCRKYTLEFMSLVPQMVHLKEFVWSDIGLSSAFGNPFRVSIYDKPRKIYFPRLTSVKLISRTLGNVGLDVLRNERLMKQLQVLHLTNVQLMQVLIDGVSIADELVELNVSWQDERVAEDRTLWPTLLNVLNSKQNLQSIKLTMLPQPVLDDREPDWLIVRDKDGQVVDWTTLLNRRTILECEITAYCRDPKKYKDFVVQDEKLAKRMITNQSLFGLRELLVPYVSCIVANASSGFSEICSTLIIENPFLDFFVRHPSYYRNAGKRGLLKGWLEKQVHTDAWEDDLKRALSAGERERIGRKIDGIRAWQLKTFKYLLPRIGAPQMAGSSSSSSSSSGFSSISSSSSSSSVVPLVMSQSERKSVMADDDDVPVRSGVVAKRRFVDVSAQPSESARLSDGFSDEKENARMVDVQPAAAAYAAPFTSTSSSSSSSVDSVNGAQQNSSKPLGVRQFSSRASCRWNRL